MSLARQFRSFLLVGGLCTLLQYAILVILVQGTGMDAVLASSIGFAASSVVSFALNRRFTFASRVGYGKGLARFAVVAGCGLALTAVLMTVGVDWLGVNYLLAQVATTGVVLLWNFFVNRSWTFGSLSPGTGSRA